MPVNKIYRRYLMNVLVIRLSAMGDVAIATPIVNEVCKTYHDVHFDFLSTPFFEPFFQKNENFEFLGVNLKGKSFCSVLKLFGQLRRKNYDVVIDLHDVLRTKVLRVLFRFCGVKVYKIDKGRREKQELTRKNNKIKRQLRPSFLRYADVFSEAGFPIDTSKNLSFSRRPIPNFEGITDKNSEKWIGVSPYAQHQGKIYPFERMTKVIQEIAKQDRAKIFIFGGGNAERTIAEKMKGSSENVIVVIGKLKLEQELALMSNLDCMISMDSSAMHLASLFGVRVISVWGATHVFAGFLGYNQSLDDVVERDLDCRPCSIYGNKPCLWNDFCCMDIPENEIIKKIK